MVVCKEFVEEALCDRFWIAQERWGTEATELFWPRFLELILEQEEKLLKTPAIIADNYVVNSDCGNIEDYLQDDESEEDCISRLQPLWVERNDNGTFIFIS